MNYKIIIAAVSLLFVVIVVLAWVFMNENAGTENAGTKNTGTENAGTKNTGDQNAGTGVVIRQQDNSVVPCIGNDCFYLLE
jgi:hypothetical protein